MSCPFFWIFWPRVHQTRRHGPAFRYEYNCTVLFFNFFSFFFFGSFFFSFVRWWRKSELWQADVSWLDQRGRTGSQQSVDIVVKWFEFFPPSVLVLEMSFSCGAPWLWFHSIESMYTLRQSHARWLSDHVVVSRQINQGLSLIHFDYYSAGFYSHSGNNAKWARSCHPLQRVIWIEFELSQNDSNDSSFQRIAQPKLPKKNKKKLPHNHFLGSFRPWDPLFLQLHPRSVTISCFEPFGTGNCSIFAVDIV